VIVENKPGAGSRNAIQVVMKEPDTQKRFTEAWAQALD
jgi:hypothetical protein